MESVISCFPSLSMSWIFLDILSSALKFDYVGDGLSPVSSSLSSLFISLKREEDGFHID